MVNYQNAKIYSIRSYQTDMIYIGSTCRHLSKRLYDHKQDYKLWQNGKDHYVSSFEIIKYDDAYIELIENFPCSDKNELHRREGQLIRELGNVVNKVVAGRTPKERYKDNYQQILEKQKKYYYDNIDKRLKYTKQYYQKNINSRKEYGRNHYLKNKEQILEKNKIKCICKCGTILRKRDLPRHLRSNKHKKRYNKYIYDCAIESGATHELANDIAYN